MDINNSKETFQQQKPKENTLCARNLEPLKPHQKALILEAIFTRNFLPKCLYPLNYTTWAVQRYLCKMGMQKWAVQKDRFKSLRPLPILGVSSHRLWWKWLKWLKWLKWKHPRLLHWLQLRHRLKRLKWLKWLKWLKRLHCGRHCSRHCSHGLLLELWL